MPHYKEKMLCGPQFMEKSFAARNLQEKCVAQMHLAGHMWFVGSVFETPALMACNEDPPYSIMLNEIKNKSIYQNRQFLLSFNTCFSSCDNIKQLSQ
jgi:hypothetical protein